MTYPKIGLTRITASPVAMKLDGIFGILWYCNHEQETV